jgi:hypothetical protein
MPGCQRQRRGVSPQYLRSTARLLTQAPARCRYGAPDIPRWAGADSGVAELSTGDWGSGCSSHDAHHRLGRWREIVVKFNDVSAFILNPPPRLCHRYR